jgi:hypothetical protein
MELDWIPLDNAVERCFSGQLENGITVAGLLAAQLALARGLAGLRTPAAPWRARKGAAQAAVLHETRPAGGA